MFSRLFELNDDSLGETTPSEDPAPALEEKTAEELNKLAFEELTATPSTSLFEDMLQQKLASVEDTGLYEIAFNMTGDAEQALHDYEVLGGTYKHAFGQPMFNTQQMAGSPAVSGGMAAKAQTPGPRMQSSPVSVTTTSIGGQSQTQGGPSPTSAPSATSTTG